MSTDDGTHHRRQCHGLHKPETSTSRMGLDEPAVWTERMLTALEEGVKGGVWFRLIDKVYAPRTLAAAWQRVKANDGAAGVDHVTVDDVSNATWTANWRSCRTRCATGTYRPQAIRRAWIPKPGSREQRPLGIPTVRDRVVQTALRTCWNRSSSGRSPSTATAFGPAGLQRRPAARGALARSRATRTSWMRT